jgi:hypothetical protein
MKRRSAAHKGQDQQTWFTPLFSDATMEVIAKGNPMNPAAEHIIRWHLERCAISSEEAGVLMSALAKGYSLGQDDAVALANQYISLARAGAVEEEDRLIIETMYLFHIEYEAVDQHERTLDALTKVRAVLQSQTSSPLSDRLTRTRLIAISNELQARRHA